MSGIYVKYLVCYDIADGKKRKRFYEGLKDLGLVPIQKSVFYGDLKPPEVKTMVKMINDQLDSKEDSCLWFPCYLSVDHIKSCLGLSDFNYISPDANGIV